MADKEKSVWEQLAAPFHPSDVSFYIQSLTRDKSQALLIPFVNRSAIINRLNSVLGVENWEDSYEEWQSPMIHLDSSAAIAAGVKSVWKDKQKTIEQDPLMVASLIQSHYQKGVKCTLRCRENKKSDWVSKQGIAPNSDIESVKGGASNALKRSASQYGVGLYLSSLKQIWVPITVNNDPTGMAEWCRYGRDDIYYTRPDLRNFGAGDPGKKGEDEVIPVTLGQPGATVPQGTPPAQGSGSVENSGSNIDLFGAPTALAPAELNDYLARVSKLIQNNKQSLDLYRQINDQPSSLDKVSKLIGCLYFVAAQNKPGGEHQMAVQTAATNKQFGEMLSTLKTVLADMEAGIWK